MNVSVARRCGQVALLAMAVLILEVALTRDFAFMMFCHFTYLVISVALLGFGAAGTYLTAWRPESRHASGDEFIARHAWYFGVASIGAVVLISRIRFYPVDVFSYGDYSQLLSLLIIVVAAGIPFFFAGSCIGFIVSRSGEGVTSVYFADLAGAAVGCLMAIVVLVWLGAVAACFVVGAAAMVVAVMSGTVRRTRYLRGSGVAAVLALVVANTNALPLDAPPDKVLFRQQHLIELTKWHPITRLDVTRPLHENRSFGGALSERYSGPPPEVRFIYQDGDAITGIIRPENSPETTEVLGYYLQGAPYSIRKAADVLTIGCGGGVDVMIALHGGAKHVVGVDVNPQTVALLEGRYANFARGVFQRDDVELVAAEGRHFLTRDDRRFDVIQLSGVDTFTALTSGAYALTENFIYTRQALDAYLEHLRPDGIVNFSRPMLTPPRETLKLALTAAEALEALGAERPAEHIVVLAGKGVASAHPVPWAQTMIKRSPFTRDEVAALQTFVQSLGFEMVFDPFTPRQGRLDAFLRAPAARRAEMTADYPLDIRPATDDRPFFFQFYRWSDLWRFGQPRRQATPVAVTVIYAAFVQVTLLSALFILYPLYRTQRMVGQAGGRAGVFAYFGAVGLGFIMIEVALLQKFTVFLGGPAYSMAVTLFAILLTSGIGSFVSGRIPASPMTLLAVVLPLLAVTAVTGSIVYGPLTGSLLGLSHAGRCVAAVAMLAPLGLLMGMPFPTALRLVNRHRPELNAWAWGINACATVVGTVLCMMVSSAFGFSHAIQVGAVLYVVSLVSVVASHRSLASAPVPAEMEAATAGIVG